MNRSAKDREWSSLQYGGEGVLVPLYRTKVFADDTMRKIIVVTLGELLSFLVKDKRPYKHSEMGSEASGVVGQLNSTISLVKAKLPAKASGVWMGKATGKNGWR